MSNVFCIIDSSRGIIAICDTIESAYILDAEYCDTEYHDHPENVEDVWIDERNLNTFGY